ncbi:MAG: 16S rRNA processing protein RimM [Alphaproteobacteria bacterium]|nr:16S rRNA processing protein RimM [Alphaproteobacteria bacterium]
MAKTTEKVCVGVFAGAHGVRGLLKIRSFTVNPSDILAYDELYDETFTHTFKPQEKSRNKDVIIVEIEGINDRDKALELKGKKLYVRREAMPELPEETFYHVDLIGLTVFTANGEEKGKVTEVFNFGAGDVLEVKTADDALVMIPFTKKDVPEVNVKEGKITVASEQWFAGLKEGEKEDV